MYTLLKTFFINFQQSRRQALFTGMKGQNSVGFYDVMNQKQNRTNRTVQTGTKFLIE
jgi:hypothetical protein